MHAGRFVITGLPGTELPADLAALWRRYRVGGVILFRYNVAGPEQLRRLVGDLREVLGERALVFETTAPSRPEAPGSQQTPAAAGVPVNKVLGGCS